MSATDILKTVQTLQEAGFNEQQAKAIVSAKDESSEATKTDIADLRTDMANLRIEIYKMAVGIVVATTTLAVASVKFL